MGEENLSPSRTKQNRGGMAKAKHLGLASAAELAIVVTLTAGVYAQVAGPSPSLNLQGATGPTTADYCHGLRHPTRGGRPAAGHDFGPGFYLQTGRSNRRRSTAALAHDRG
jgi:hypothetical protein